MSSETETATFFEHVRSLQHRREPFAIATVIAVRGSASAKPGSKAIITQEGKNIWGWVGGGCAESFVAQNAVESMKDGQTRIVQADLDDEIFGLGMPCGGVMDVFIDPQLPPEFLELHGPSEIADSAVHLSSQLGFISRFEARTNVRNSASPVRQALLSVATALAKTRAASFHSLRQSKGVFALKPTAEICEIDEVLILGSSRITEEIARMATVAGWPVRIYGSNINSELYPASTTIEKSEPGYENLYVNAKSAVLVASHHKGDPEFIAQALRSQASYVGLIASEKRSRLVMQSLAEQGFEEKVLARVHAPAGLDLGCRTPAEIGLSCLAELILLTQPREA